MKKLYFLLLAFSLFTAANAQIVNIPDANFKAKLLTASSSNMIAKNLSGSYFKIDANNDGEIQESEALAVSYLKLSDFINGITEIYDLTGIQSFKNIKNLDCLYQKLTSLDVSSLINLAYLNCGFNKLISLNVSSLANLNQLECYNNQLTALDVSTLVNLTQLNCGNNKLTFLDVSSLAKLTQLGCYNNQLTTLDVSSLVNLTKLQCHNNLLTHINTLNCINLNDYYCAYNRLTTMDVSTNLTGLSVNFNASNNLLTSINLPIFNQSGRTVVDLSNNSFESLELSPNITFFFFNNMPNLKYLNTKNVIFSYSGYDFLPFGDFFTLNNCPNIKYICCNENNLQGMQLYLDSLSYNCHVNSYCSFVPGGTFYTIQGNQKFDSNSNGCDSNDINYPYLKFSISDGITNGSLISNSTGNYSIPILAGTHTISPVLENPSYFKISPTTVNVTFPTQSSPFIQNFCITPNGVRNDLEVTLIPLVPARPGFDAKYKIVYKNKGNQTQSGAVSLTFNDAVLDLVVANPVTSTQTTNNLSWSFANLLPFETREITFTLNVNSPMETPAVNNDDVLNFTTTVTSVAIDETPADNTFTLNQVVVNSFDPNDKTCLEGTTISPALIGQYVHYMIRFENSGTANARNIVVKDMIDLSKFDISTLVPTSASHSFVTNITAGNKVEFIFENINLPFDDANNDGYIAFKIKTLPTLKVGNTFTNDASIYFDYNFPIVTNIATSTFKTLGTQDFEFSSYFTLYPNPAKAVLNISSKETIEVRSISIYNTLGQLVLVIPNAEKLSKIDVSSLTTGNYFIKLNSDKGSSNARFVKE